MKTITYTLTTDGHTPEYIIDGGYFPKPNQDMVPPQDLTLVGIADDSAPGDAISFNDLVAYVTNFMPFFYDLYGNSLPCSEVVDVWWKARTL